MATPNNLLPIVADCLLERAKTDVFSTNDAVMPSSVAVVDLITLHSITQVQCPMHVC
jgi:hypothetical protein